MPKVAPLLEDEHTRVTLALLAAQAFLELSKAMGPKNLQRRRWLQSLGTDALDLTCAQQELSMELAAAFGEKPLEQSDPQFLLAHRQHLRLVAPSERPPLHVPGMRRQEFTSVMAGLEILCLHPGHKFRPADVRNIGNLQKWLSPWIHSEVPQEEGALEAFFRRNLQG